MYTTVYKLKDTRKKGNPDKIRISFKIKKSARRRTRSGGPRLCVDRSEAQTIELRALDRARNNKKGNIPWMLPFCCYESARRGSNPRPPPWQGGAPPLSHSRIFGSRLSQRPKLIIYKSYHLVKNFLKFYSTTISAYFTL